MARLTERGLRRSVGVPGLFATAYGNVGSSIYYALGLVAALLLSIFLLPTLYVWFARESDKLPEIETGFDENG